jgi:hypothetical protein
VLCRLQFAKYAKKRVCKYKQNFCCLKILQYSLKILHVVVCIVVTNFTNAWKLVKEVHVIRQSAASARLNLPVRSIILLDLSVMSVCCLILMRIDMFLGVPCEIK